jgi:hypothetical protein
MTMNLSMKFDKHIGVITFGQREQTLNKLGGVVFDGFKSTLNLVQPLLHGNLHYFP